MSKQKAYTWCGAVDNKYEVKIIPQGNRQLVNFAIEKSKTYRDDMEGFGYSFYSDTPFQIYITKGKNTIVSFGAEERNKYWCSTLEDAVEKAKKYLYKKGDKYYIYKRTDNLYEMFISQIGDNNPLQIVTFEQSHIYTINKDLTTLPGR